MRLCRFDDDRLGWVDGDGVRDVTGALDRLPSWRWPLPAADPLWAGLDALRAGILAAAARTAPVPLERVRLGCPVPRPGKILAVRRNRGPRAGDRPDVFLKAPSAVAGPADELRVPRLGRAVECELELALVIGRPTFAVPADEALAAVAGCCLALDLAVAGEEDRGLRKSLDGFCVLGPWVTEPSDLPALGSLELSLTVAGERRQGGRLGDQPFDAAAIVAYLASLMTLQPGDVLLTGCPSAAIVVQPGDVLQAACAALGDMQVEVRPA